VIADSSNLLPLLRFSSSGPLLPDIPPPRLARWSCRKTVKPEGRSRMLVKTILNRSGEHSSFVYHAVRFREDGSALEIEVRSRRGARPVCSGCSRAARRRGHGALDSLRRVRPSDHEAEVEPRRPAAQPRLVQPLRFRRPDPEGLTTQGKRGRRVKEEGRAIPRPRALRHLSVVSISAPLNPGRCRPSSAPVWPIVL
jgi:hypothetical protein